MPQHSKSLEEFGGFATFSGSFDTARVCGDAVAIIILLFNV
jgi:hypothetical protein